MGTYLQFLNFLLQELKHLLKLIKVLFGKFKSITKQPKRKFMKIQSKEWLRK